MDWHHLENLARLLRYYCVVSTTEAGSGHLTSSLSAVDLMTVLLFGGHFRFKVDDPDYANNDRLIFSKGHAAPLFYALWSAAGKLTIEDLKQLRKFDSPLEGHPAMRFTYTEAATGSLGQGLSIGVGMALNGRYLDALPYTTWVLLGDSEMAEGSVWEAMQAAAYYKLGNLVGILDVNRLGQRGPTMYGHDVENYRKKAEAFGWTTIVIDGHDLQTIHNAYTQVASEHDRPTLLIAKTIKGKGVIETEDELGWHAKQISKEHLAQALSDIGEVDVNWRGQLTPPEERTANVFNSVPTPEVKKFGIGELVATKKAFGDSLPEIGARAPNMVVLDAEVSNSTGTDVFEKAYHDRFFEMFIMEQNMVGTAVGLSARGKKPVVSTFGAFLTRAFDQIRMAQYSHTNMVVAGSYAGVSLGMDGSSQMALEDMAMMRAIKDSIVLYPADAVATKKLTELGMAYTGISYLRLTREPTPVMYGDHEVFRIGGSKVLKQSDSDVVTVIAAGITLTEALKAYEKLYGDGIMIRVIDAYSVKPLDIETLQTAAEQTQALVVVEDHYPAGGLGEAVMSAQAHMDNRAPIYHLAVHKMPRSGKPAELLAYEEIDAEAIVKKVCEIVGTTDN